MAIDIIDPNADFITTERMQQVSPFRDPNVANYRTDTIWRQVSPRFSRIPLGEKFTRAAVTKGDHLHALPYWSKYEQFNTNPPYTLSFDITTLNKLLNPKEGVTLRDKTVLNGLGFTGVSENDILGVKSISQKDKDFVRRMAHIKATASLRKGLINSPLLIAERLQTMNMAKERVGDMMRVVKSIQDRDVKRFKKLRSAKSRKAFAQKAASTHLELIFGWLPLIDEIEGAVELATAEHRDFIIGRGRHTIVEKKSQKESLTNVNVPMYLSKVERSSYSIRTNLRCAITSHFAANARKMGFNPLYSVYDLTPLSFITGWFSNFNYMVQSLDPLIGAEFVTGSDSIRDFKEVRRLYAGHGSNLLPDMYKSTISGFGQHSGSVDLRVREVITALPDISFELYNNLSPYSVFAGISLYLQRNLKPLQQAIKSKPFRYRSKKPIYLPPIKYVSTRG